VASPSRIRGADRSLPVDGPARTGIIAAGTVVAGGAWLLTRWFAIRFMISPNSAGLAAFCAAWIALYPIARLNRSVPPWARALGTWLALFWWCFGW
jgi:hypothetical protein